MEVTKLAGVKSVAIIESEREEDILCCGGRRLYEVFRGCVLQF